jgi:hypothetical protein
VGSAREHEDFAFQVPHARRYAQGFAAGRIALAINEFHDKHGQAPFWVRSGRFQQAASIGRFEAGESRTYRFIVLLVKGTPEDELERSAGAIYDWNVAPSSADDRPESGVL